MQVWISKSYVPVVFYRSGALIALLSPRWRDLTPNGNTSRTDSLSISPGDASFVF